MWYPDVLTNGKTQTFSEIIGLLHSHSQGFFANFSLKFSNMMTAFMIMMITLAYDDDD